MELFTRAVISHLPSEFTKGTPKQIQKRRGWRTMKSLLEGLTRMATSLSEFNTNTSDELNLIAVIKKERIAQNLILRNLERVRSHYRNQKGNQFGYKCTRESYCSS